MNDKIKDKVVTITFLSIIIIMLIINIIKKDEEISISERRKLETFPNFKVESLFDGSFFEKIDKYTMDQFFKREGFRKLKAKVEIKILNKQEINNIYEYDKSLIEQIYPLNQKSVFNITKKMQEINEKYITKSNKVYYTIIPDKSYFVNQNNLKLDYNKMQEIIAKEIHWATYINIFDDLKLSDYYYTDSHWKQENLQDVANTIAKQMHSKTSDNYKQNKITEFKGVYAGRYLLETRSDEIITLTNETIENCKVYNHENRKTTPIYDMEKVNSPDKYDIYLSGATPILTITNPKNREDRKLVVFRDSYASSLIPLLVEGYSRIDVIDTRYISPKILEKYVDFEEKDILFAYSTMIINNSYSLK